MSGHPVYSELMEREANSKTGREAKREPQFLEILTVSIKSDNLYW